VRKVRFMAEEVKVEVATPVVDTPSVEVSELETLRTRLAELESSFQAKVNQASRAEREKFEKQLLKEKMTTEETHYHKTATCRKRFTNYVSERHSIS
jgi:hypothetical protein